MTNSNFHFYITPGWPHIWVLVTGISEAHVSSRADEGLAAGGSGAPSLCRTV